MAKTSVQFICRACGSVQSRWAGKCTDCGQWNTLEEHRVARGAAMDPLRGAAGGAGVTGAGVIGAAAVAEPPRARAINDVQPDVADGLRIATGINELDRVLGGHAPPPAPPPAGEVRVAGAGAGAGGIVPGSAILLGGDPGIGKSTLMLQAARQLARARRRVLYVTSEESAQQLQQRAERLDALGDGCDNLLVLADTNLARIIEQARQTGPAVMIVDSIQMIYKGDLPAAPGSVTQLRNCCLELVYHAKASGTALLLVGHVTKKGQVAGPRLLEHMVDTVLYFEGDRFHSHRVVRATKNRFGSTLEVGLFEMGEQGLSEVHDAAGVAASEYHARAGSVICPVMQGSRCLLVEIQALTATGILGAAKRKVSGLDGNRLAVLIAVLEKRAGLRLADQDVFTSSVGGMRVAEPAADLALALAIASAHHNRSLPERVCAVGEVGLGGEIRHVQQLEQRAREAQRLGFEHVIAPAPRDRARTASKLPGVIGVQTLDEAMQHLQ